MSDLSRFYADISKPNQIKSIQIVNIPAQSTSFATPISKTINEVVVGNSIVLSPSFPVLYSTFAKIFLSNPTTLQIQFVLTQPSFYNMTLIVIEFNASAIKSRQTGTTTIGANSTTNITISAVNPNKCLVASYYSYTNERRVIITNLTATTLSLYNPGTSSITTPTVYWEILELR